MTPAPGLNSDFVDLLAALLDAGAEFVVVGAHAMAAHGVARSTGDLEVLVRPGRDNATRVLHALHVFGAPLEAHGMGVEDLSTAGTVYQIGQPPRRIDLLTAIDGVDFAAAWASRILIEVAGRPVPFIGLDALVRNKRATGRDRDLVDVRLLTGR